MQTVCRLMGGNQRFRRPCCNGVHRHDQPAVWRVEVSVWSPAGDRQGNAAAPLQRPGHCRAAGESVTPVWVLLRAARPWDGVSVFVPSSRPHSRKKPSRRLTICWRATWASETASWVRVSPSPVSQAICVRCVCFRWVFSDLCPCPQRPPWLSWERTKRTQMSSPRP